MCIEYGIEDMGHIRYFVAPKIEADGEMAEEPKQEPEAKDEIKGEDDDE